MPSAREELERERALYSQHEPNTSLMPEREAARRAAAENGNSAAASNRAGRQNNPISNHAQRAQRHPGNQGARANRQAARTGQRRQATAQGKPSRQNARRSQVEANENGEFQQHSRYSTNGQQRAQRNNAAAGNSTQQPRPRRASADGQRPSAARRNAATAGAASAAAAQTGSARKAQAAPAQQRPSAQSQQAAQPSRSQQMPAIANVSAQDAAAYSRANYRRGGNTATGNTTSASAYSAARYVNGGSNGRKPKQKANFFSGKGLIAVCIVAVLAVVGIFGVTNWMSNKAVQITLNGDSVTVSGSERSIGGLLDAGRVSVTAGNFVAVDGSTIRQGEGTRCTAKVNGNETTDMGTHLNGGDKVEISNGTDVSEPYTDSDSQTLAHSVEIKGTGAVHLYSTDAQDGEQVTRTGKDSGISTQVVTKEPVNTVVQYYNVNTGGDKVIALTFDDGPWDSQTDEILDILKENDAKATFFTVGQCISSHETQVKRAADMGCEIGTHTWDHAEGSGQGVSLIKMSSQERKDEVTKGLDAIEKATGAKASTIFRCPGGNYDQSVASDLEGLVTAEIGWNIDTTDWKKPGASVIAQRIESASPGNIILMHDGGGDRSQTIEGLREALPKLKAQGYSFVTVQELIEKYPYSGN